MDILAMRDAIRSKDEPVMANLVNDRGQVLGTLAIEDMLFAMHSVDVLDFFGEFTANPDCPKGASTIGVAIDLGFQKLDAGMIVIKGHKGWKDVKKLYQLSGARKGGVYWHSECMDIRDLRIDEMPSGENLEDEVEVLDNKGEAVSTLKAIAPNFPEAVTTSSNPATE